MVKTEGLIKSLLYILLKMMIVTILLVIYDYLN